MDIFSIKKVIGSLTGELDPNTVYLVRVGEGFDLKVTNSKGLVNAYHLNSITINQELGDSSTSVMSQQSVTSEINNLNDNISNNLDILTKTLSGLVRASSTFSTNTQQSIPRNTSEWNQLEWDILGDNTDSELLEVVEDQLKIKESGIYQFTNFIQIKNTGTPVETDVRFKLELDGNNVKTIVEFINLSEDESIILPIVSSVELNSPGTIRIFMKLSGINDNIVLTNFDSIVMMSHRGSDFATKKYVDDQIASPMILKVGSYAILEHYIEEEG